MNKLSPREVQTIEALSGGETVGQISNRLGIAKQTVSAFIKRAKEKLGAETSQQACVIYDRDCKHDTE